MSLACASVVVEEVGPVVLVVDSWSGWCGLMTWFGVVLCGGM